MNIGGGGGNGPYNNIPMFWEMDNVREFTNFIIPLDEYESRLKQKEREIKLNKIL